MGDGGAKQLMISAYKPKATALKIHVAGIPESGTVTVESIEAGKQREPHVSTLTYTGDVLDLGPMTGSVVKLIKFPQ